MSVFEYNFTLFGLLLGLILVEVLSGFVRTLHVRRPTGPGIEATTVRIGWLTPMLGVFVMLDIVGWWGNIWNAHWTLPMGYDTLLGGLILCSFYYFAASMIFPQQPRDWPDLDDWFWTHRRQVLGSILLANLVWLPITFIHNPGIPVGMLVVVNSLLYGLLLLATVARKPWIVTSAMTLLIGLNLSFIPLEMLRRVGVW